MSKEDDLFHLGMGRYMVRCASLEEYGRLDFSPVLVRMRIQNWSHLKTRTKSPIEILMSAALLFAQTSHGTFNYHWPGEHGELEIRPPPRGCVFLEQQPVGAYLADFIVYCFAGDQKRMIAVECDGHDFHEKTKEQAQRDKARDRYFVSQGITMLRFTGSEIFRNAEGCAAEVGLVADRLIAEMTGHG